jgi:hypothetical protein
MVKAELDNMVTMKVESEVENLVDVRVVWL